MILDTGFQIRRLRNSARPGADLRITLQHCMQTKTRQIAHYNVNGLGQGLQNVELRSGLETLAKEISWCHLRFFAKRNFISNEDRTTR